MKALQTIGMAILATLLAGTAAADGLRHVRQSVFGMDCAPCAYGVEKSLRALPGVQEVTVSLNEGYAEADLGPDSATTLAQIREAVRNNGFTPKQASLRIEGEFSPTPAPTVHSGTQVYRLKLDGPVPRLADKLRVSISGTVAAESDDEIVVKRIVAITAAD